MTISIPPLSLYVHFPWCIQKCPYCDFNSHKAGDNPPRERYVEALCADLLIESRKASGRVIESIFLGGGTPSFFTPDEIGAVLHMVNEHLLVHEDCEITMEANPGTVECGSLSAYRKAGVTRLSIGAQSFDRHMLTVLGRIHGPQDIRNTYDQAKAAGFESINIDLMFSLPGQDAALATTDVEFLLELSPPHISYYQLTLEPNTVFYKRPPDGLPDDDLSWEIQQQGQALLTNAGYEQYEVSAFAKPGHRCLHNINYWTFGDYLAAGAGAHGKLTDTDGAVWRYHKPASPRHYMDECETGEVSSQPARVENPDLGFEFMLNALRLKDGVPETLLHDRTGLNREALIETLDKARTDGLIDMAGTGILRPSANGFQFLNDLQARFLPS